MVADELILNPSPAVEMTKEFQKFLTLYHCGILLLRVSTLEKAYLLPPVSKALSKKNSPYLIHELSYFLRGNLNIYRMVFLSEGFRFPKTQFTSS